MAQRERLLQIVSGVAIWRHPAAWCRSAMYWFATLTRNSSHRLLCAPISIRPARHPSLLRPSRSPLPKSVVILVSRPNGNGLILPSCARRPPFSACSLNAMGQRSLCHHAPARRTAGWYPKPLPTLRLSDALATVRQELWTPRNFETSSRQQTWPVMPFEWPKSSSGLQHQPVLRIRRREGKRPAPLHRSRISGRSARDIHPGGVQRARRSRQIDAEAAAARRVDHVLALGWVG
jgi:hypothetical protein